MSYYELYEFNHAALSPFRAAADATRLLFQNPFNPFAHTPLGRSVAAAAELFERATRRYAKPEWRIADTVVGGVHVPVTPKGVWERPFCKLVHFEKQSAKSGRHEPTLLIVAPMSGHYATLLRGTVQTMLPSHDVYITDWADARMVPLAEGSFDLDDYIDYLISILHFLGPDVHVMAVCQPSVPVLAAASLMSSSNDAHLPATIILMGGPVDTRINPSKVDDLSTDHDIDWFRRNVVMKVPFPHPGFMRDVYPGFLQLSGFMQMNLNRHLEAHRDLFRHLVAGDGDSVEKHREFYDEYLAVMDLTAEFYLQTVDTVFKRHALPKGEMIHRGQKVDPGAITKVAMFTIEGEHDDITGLGHTRAAHDLTTSLPADMREHYLAPSVGHYGVFNGSRFRADIAPRIADFIATHRRDGVKPTPRKAAAKARAESAAAGAASSAVGAAGPSKD